MLKLLLRSAQALIFLSLLFILQAPKLKNIDRVGDNVPDRSQLEQTPKQLSLSPSASVSLARDKKYICPADLDRKIGQIINREGFDRLSWGILIQTLATEKTIYAKNAEKYVLPASNAKLLTTAAALSQLGSRYRFYTSVYGEGTLPNLTALRVVGSKDPSLNTAQLEQLADLLKAKGVRRISRLIIENSRPYINPTWEWSDVREYYAVGVYDLNLNENAVILTILPQRLGQKVKLDWSDEIAARQWAIENQAVTAPENTPYGVEIKGVFVEPSLKIQGELAIDSGPDIWGLAIPDQSQYFLTSFRKILRDRGIQVDSEYVDRRPFSIPRGRKLATVYSDTLEILIAKTNQESNNLYAETLFQVLQDRLSAATEENAIELVLSKLGVDSNSYSLNDGSGLSRQNLVAPEAIVKTLQVMAKTPQAQIYRDSLAVAGVSGTLKNRFLNTPIRGKLQAKTGTLTGVSGLSGYLELANYETLVISIILNHADFKSSLQRDAIDEIVLLLKDLRDC